MSACRGCSGGGCWGGEKGEAEEGGVSVARDFAGELDNHDAVYGGYCLCDLSGGSVATGRARGSTGCFESIKDILLIRLWRGVVSICGGGPQNSPTAASRETSPTSAIRFRPLRSGSLPLRREVGPPTQSFGQSCAVTSLTESAVALGESFDAPGFNTGQGLGLTSGVKTNP